MNDCERLAGATSASMLVGLGRWRLMELCLGWSPEVLIARVLAPDALLAALDPPLAMADFDPLAVLPDALTARQDATPAGPHPGRQRFSWPPRPVARDATAAPEPAAGARSAGPEFPVSMPSGSASIDELRPTARHGDTQIGDRIRPASYRGGESYTGAGAVARGAESLRGGRPGDGARVNKARAESPPPVDANRHATSTAHSDANGTAWPTANRASVMLDAPAAALPGLAALTPDAERPAGPSGAPSPAAHHAAIDPAPLSPAPSGALWGATNPAEGSPARDALARIGRLAGELLGAQISTGRAHRGTGTAAAADGPVRGRGNPGPVAVPLVGPRGLDAKGPAATVFARPGTATGLPAPTEARPQAQLEARPQAQLEALVESDPYALARLINEALIEQARLAGVDLS